MAALCWIWSSLVAKETKSYGPQKKESYGASYRPNLHSPCMLLIEAKIHNSQSPSSHRVLKDLAGKLLGRTHRREKGSGPSVQIKSSIGSPCIELMKLQCC
ncbi:hypothetical protein HS088_TW03G00544 [Tripterygium wilfordii]|uniref:Uncharacterized protein n=1 Tax=Tripterygium wilfordii TaxID=458696 RepID=A0A7J7DV85_TRIWF|nr:hypothetical protein HS088_TW03G00544 [Tripterygium wilfordii]